MLSLFCISDNQIYKFVQGKILPTVLVQTTPPLHFYSAQINLGVKGLGIKINKAIKGQAQFHKTVKGQAQLHKTIKGQPLFHKTTKGQSQFHKTLKGQAQFHKTIK